MKTRLLIYFSLILAGCTRPEVKNAQQAAPAPMSGKTLEKSAETLPPPATNTPESTVRKMFPNAPETVRSIDCFRSFPRGVSMFAIVSKCGRPDGEFGSGIGIFVYRLNDGSTINILWTDFSHIQDIKHVDRSGKTTSLLREP